MFVSAYGAGIRPVVGERLVEISGEGWERPFFFPAGFKEADDDDDDDDPGSEG